jgi:hypothetical protein
MTPRIKSIAELKQIIDKVQWQRFLDGKMEFYRGHSLRSYELKPGLTRYEFTESEYIQKEKKIYEDFVDLYKTKDDYIRLPFTEENDSYELRNKWYSLFQGQHIGLKTRFTDWTIGWETALMFAVNNEDEFGQDGSFWIFRIPDEFEYNKKELKEVVILTADPFGISKNMMINTPIQMLNNRFDYVGERRMGRQSGRFWIQSLKDSMIPMDKQDVLKPHMLEIIIDGDSKESIKSELKVNGVTLDWHYYRTDANVDEEIKTINKNNLS